MLDVVLKVFAPFSHVADVPLQRFHFESDHAELSILQGDVYFLLLGGKADEIFLQLVYDRARPPDLAGCRSARRHDKNNGETNDRLPCTECGAHASLPLGVKWTVPPIFVAPSKRQVHGSSGRQTAVRLEHLI